MDYMVPCMLNFFFFPNLVNLVIEHVQKIKEAGGKKRRRGGDDDDDNDNNDVEKYLRLKTGKGGKMSKNGKTSKKLKRR